MEETFKKTITETIEQIEKQLSSLSGRTTEAGEIKEQQKMLSSEMEQFKLRIAGINQSIKTFSSSFNLMKELSKKLEHYIHLLENTVEKKEHHVHHFRWPFGVAVAIFLLLVISVSWLYNEHQKLEQYIANDTKYRSLQLMKDKDLKHYLHLSDSIYQTDPDMRKHILQQEAERERRLELLQQAREKQKEAEELRRKAEKMGSKVSLKS